MVQNHRHGVTRRGVHLFSVTLQHQPMIPGQLHQPVLDVQQQPRAGVRVGVVWCAGGPVVEAGSALGGGAGDPMGHALARFRSSLLNPVV
jgi:hypothetical protein